MGTLDLQRIAFIIGKEEASVFKDYLDQVANRLSVVEIEAHPMKDLLNFSQSRKERKEKIRK